MIIELLTGISLVWNITKWTNDDYFYDLETDKRKYENCKFVYVGKQEVTGSAVQLFPKKINEKKYIYWKHQCENKKKQ